jgi:hypothetical protein
MHGRNTEAALGPLHITEPTSVNVVGMSFNARMASQEQLAENVR